MYLTRNPFAKDVTAAQLDAWIIEGLLMYRVAKNQEDKDALRAHILDCQLAISMLPRSPGSPTSPTSSRTKKAKEAKKDKLD